MQQAYALIRKDIDQFNLERTELVAQAIHLLMQSGQWVWRKTIPVQWLVLCRSWTSFVGCLLPDGSNSE